MPPFETDGLADAKAPSATATIASKTKVSATVEYTITVPTNDALTNPTKIDKVELTGNGISTPITLDNVSGSKEVTGLTAGETYSD